MQSIMKGSHRRQFLADIEQAFKDSIEGTHPYEYYQQTSVHQGWRSIVDKIQAIAKEHFQAHNT